MKQDLGVGLRLECMSFAFQGGTQILKVVNLPVERDPDGVVLVAHRLAASARAVDDGEPRLAESDESFGAGEDLVANAIGTAVAHGPGHSVENFGGSFRCE